MSEQNAAFRPPGLWMIQVIRQLGEEFTPP
jgi:hypothetical protein